MSLEAAVRRNLSFGDGFRRMRQAGLLRPGAFPEITTARIRTTEGGFAEVPVQPLVFTRFNEDRRVDIRYTYFQASPDHIREALMASR